MNNPSFYYMPISGWLSLMSNRFLVKRESNPSNNEKTVFRITNGKDESSSCCFVVNPNCISFIP